MTTWLPDITQESRPKYLAIAEAIGSAVADGSLASGAKLPPQRNLAYDLGVTLGTVTRAYREAERRGLVGGEVGRGTFVLGTSPRRPDGIIVADAPEPGIIDFTHATPAQGVAGRELARVLAEIASESEIDALANYQLHTGLAPHLEAGVHWLGKNGLKGTVDNVTMTNGVQNGILASFMALTDPGDTILLEELTYPGALHLARTFGHRIEPIRMDKDGLIPEALDEVCRRTSARVLYCTPTLQNPTTAVIPEKRREKIAEIAKRQGLLIIEDDIWGQMTDIELPHFANLLPEQTIYLSSLSKCVAGGLRIGYAFAPPRLTERLRSAVRMTCWMPAPLMAEVARRWIYDGTCDALAAWQRQEIATRCATLLDCLKPHQARHANGSHHVWIQLPPHWSTTEFLGRAQEHGVRVLGAQSFAVHQQNAPEAIRVSVGRPVSVEQVRKGAEILAALLEDDTDRDETFI